MNTIVVSKAALQTLARSGRTARLRRHAALASARADDERIVDVEITLHDGVALDDAVLDVVAVLDGGRTLVLAGRRGCAAPTADLTHDLRPS